MQKLIEFFRRNKYLAIGAGIAALLAAGFLLYRFKLNPPPSAEEAAKEKANISVGTPLGNDPAGILAEARKRQEKSDYFAEYDMAVTGPFADPKRSRFRLVEKKWDNFFRLDSYLGDTALINSFIKNNNGVFDCNFAESRKEAPCYKLAPEAAVPGSAFNLDVGVLKELVDRRAIEASLVMGKEVSVGGDPRVCDGFDYILKGENLNEETVAAAARQMLPDISAEDITITQKLLSLLSVQSSLCFDRETGLPLISSTTGSVGTTTETTVKTAVSLIPRAEFSHTLSLSSIIEKNPDDKYFQGQYRLSHQAEDGENLYLGAGTGIFTIKDGRLVSYDTQTRGVGAMISFQGTLYAGNSGGIWAKTAEGWKFQLKNEPRGFAIHNGQLYAATIYGVFQLKDGQWIQPNASYKLPDSAQRVFSAGGFLLATTLTEGSFILDGENWRLLRESKSYGENHRFSADSGRTFARISSDFYEFKGGELALIAPFSATGGVNDYAVFNGEVYTGGTRGIYQAGKGFIADEKVMGEVADLLVYKGALYAAGETAVYRLEGDAWRVVGDQHSFTRPESLTEMGGELYGFGPLGVYRLEGDAWTGVDLISISRLISHRGHLYAVSFTDGMLHEIKSEINDPALAFALPESAKIIEFQE